MTRRRGVQGSDFSITGYFSVGYFVESTGEIQDLLDSSKVTAAIQINHGFSSDLKKGKPAEVQILLDGTDSNTATIAMNYAVRVITKYAMDISKTIPAYPGRLSQEERKNSSFPSGRSDLIFITPPSTGWGGEGDGRPARIDLRTRSWYNPNLTSRNYNVPGVIALMIMLICLLLTAMAVVREREIGTLEQLMVTPLKPFELMLGKTLPFAAIGFFDMFLVTVVGTSWFHVPIKGSVYLLTLSTAIYLLSVLGIGLFISTVSRTQQQALMATFLFFAPAVLLSGFMFPIENMPQVIQYSTYLNPLRYFLVIIRGIFLKGNGIDVLWPQMIALLTLGIVVITISSFRFKKRLE